jgi:hypothetical protein
MAYSGSLARASSETFFFCFGSSQTQSGILFLQSLSRLSCFLCHLHLYIEQRLVSVLCSLERQQEGQEGRDQSREQDDPLLCQQQVFDPLVQQLSLL